MVQIHFIQFTLLMVGDRYLPAMAPSMPVCVAPLSLLSPQDSLRGSIDGDDDDDDGLFLPTRPSWLALQGTCMRPPFAMQVTHSLMCSVGQGNC